MNTDITFPGELVPHKDKILSSLRPYIQVIPQEKKSLLPWESKIGGHPYLPANMPYPLGPDGHPLWLLAQINFEEMPALPPFPQQGLLQFFIFDDGFYGLKLDDPFDQSRFRVIFHPKPSKSLADLQSDFSFLKDPEYLPIDPYASYALDFELREELVPTSDYHFEQFMGEGFFEQFEEQEWEVKSQYNRAVMSSRHKLGGYAFFCQEDPRNPEAPMDLLFQLGSSDQFNCMWGDMGVANFFISRAALERSNFSTVMYNWDCY